MTMTDKYFLVETYNDRIERGGAEMEGISGILLPMMLVKIWHAEIDADFALLGR